MKTHHNLPRPPRPAAFTLIEILVVVAIVAVLAALMFPAVDKVRKEGQMAACSGNLRHIGGLIGTYAADNDGTFPSATDYDAEVPPMTKTPAQYSWDEKLILSGIMTASDLRLTRGGCPANQKMTKGCYGYNYEQLGNENRPQGDRFTKVTSLSEPSKTVMVMDNFAYGDGKGWSLLAWWYGSDPSDANAPGAPRGHGKLVNVLWADGHVTSQKLKDLYTHDPPNGINPDRPTPWYFATQK